MIGTTKLPPAIMKKVVGWFVTDGAGPVTGAPVNREIMPHVVRGRGQLEAVGVVDVFSPVAGQLTGVRFKAGDRFSKGEILALVRSDELLQREEKVAAAFDAAKADLRQKENQLGVAEKALERAREYHNRELISRRDLNETEAATETARAQQALARAQVEQQQAVLEQTRRLLSVSKLVAPLSGVVIRRLAEPGAFVQTSTPVFSVGAVEPLRLIIEISDRDIDFVREGAAAEIRADTLPDRLFSGQIIALQYKLETAQSVIAEIELPNRDRVLAPGMRVEATLVQDGR